MESNRSRKMPNIVLIMADQMAAPALPIYGNKVVTTPHISTLAERGVVFENAYCNSPICAPSRFSMLTSQLPCSIDAFDNASEFSADIPTIAHYLSEMGYRTTLCGKMHFVGPDQLHGFEERLVTDIYPADFAWTPNWKEGETNTPTGISVKVIREAGKCVRSLQIDYDDEVEYFANQHIYDLARDSNQRPFFLTVSFTHPHSPYTAPEKYWDLYDHSEIDTPAVPALPLESLDTHSRWLYYSHSRDKYQITEEHVRNARHAYYGMISYIDDKIGRLLDTLKKTGLEENTIIVFAADHGEMLGERGMWFKQTFFEWSSRVPLIICPLGARIGRRVPEVVSLVDLVPTLLDLSTECNPPEPAMPFEGHSMMGLLFGQGQPWKNVALSEYTDMGVCSPCRMVRKGKYKLFFTHGYPNQLFDLSKDPHELKNRAGDTEFNFVEKDLQDAVLNGWNPDTVNRRILESQKRRLLINRASICSGRYPNWSYHARPGDEHRYVRGAGIANGAAGTKAKARFPFLAPV